MIVTSSDIAYFCFNICSRRFDDTCDMEYPSKCPLYDFDVKMNELLNSQRCGDCKLWHQQTESNEVACLGYCEKEGELVPSYSRCAIFSKREIPGSDTGKKKIKKYCVFNGKTIECCADCLFCYHDRYSEKYICMYGDDFRVIVGIDPTKEFPDFCRMDTVPEVDANETVSD